MPLLDVNGVAINYIDEGTGPPVVLVHGFAASLQANWRAPVILDAIRNSDRRLSTLAPPGNDLQAVAAMQRSQRSGYDPAKLRDVKLPVMVLIGEADTLAGSADQVAAAIPGVKFVKVPGNHLTAVVAPELKRALISF